MNLETAIWLTWRQHRWSVLGVAAIALAAAFALVTAEVEQGFVRNSMPITGFYGLIVQLGFGALIGMFWGAPLLARELEDRTCFVAWGQDVTPVEWLRGKVLVLGVLAALLGAVVGAGDGYVGSSSSWSSFEADPLVQAGYAVLGLAVGVLVGLLTRHVVTAIAGTLVFFTLVRVLLAMSVRDYYFPPERVIARWENTPVVPERSLELPGGFVGQDLEPVPSRADCVSAINESSCMRRANAAIGTYVDYQPIERLTAFRIIEFVLCLLLAAVVLWVAFRLLRNGGAWRPSRSHRRIGVPGAPVSGVAAGAVTGSAAEPAAGAVAVLVAEHEAELGPETEPDAEPEPGLDPERVLEPDPALVAEPEPEPEPELDPQPEPEPEPEPEAPDTAHKAPDTAADKADG
ncbi:hypothetical protein [Lentzea sp. HUAS12]|uniref:hypothetical protein n=1 Tax=Lentzea sp. HUAS12 TaxID=2951806 RepID=UPI00209EC8CD|nr:hypothetical protein [Lentzea sp. HUAS12]USX50938.1 hypothetical protein ND450_37125 [Lentzea sp. HUAS12]